MNRLWFQEANWLDFEADGLKCAMRRGPLGAWCGYVAVPKGHPWYGLKYTNTIKPTEDMLGRRHLQDFGPIEFFCAVFSDKDIKEEMSISLAMRVHGGLTYSDNHEPFGEPDGLWWFGFDCAHAGDLIPAFAESKDHLGEVYHDQSYVVAECQSLAAQLVRIK